MCLHSVSKVYKRPQIKAPSFKYGWKWVYLDSDDSVGGYDRGGNYQRGVWIQDRNTGEIGTDDFEMYPAGFHIFVDKEAAKSYASPSCNCKLIRVRYRQVVAIGSNADFFGNRNCVIAREIYYPTQGRRAKVGKKKVSKKRAKA